MADVKWIKIVTDIFDNRKIKLIRKMPEGAELVVTWFQLLCLAGETNDNGLIYVTKTIPYTEDTLSAAFDTPLPIIRLALDTFQQLEMITIYNSFLCVSNWEKYQNVDGMERMREISRKSSAKYRERQRLAISDVTVTSRVTLGDATEEDIDKELDIDTGECEGGRPPNPTPKHRKKFVPPTLEEVTAYCRERQNGVDPNRFLDHYTANGWKQGRGKPIVDWKAAVRTWEREEKESGRNQFFGVV